MKTPKHDIENLPAVKACPICAGECKAYIHGTYGLIRCLSCGLRFEKNLPLASVIELFNKRPEIKEIQ